MSIKILSRAAAMKAAFPSDPLDRAIIAFLASLEPIREATRQQLAELDRRRAERAARRPS